MRARLRWILKVAEYALHFVLAAVTTGASYSIFKARFGAIGAAILMVIIMTAGFMSLKSNWQALIETSGHYDAGADASKQHQDARFQVDRIGNHDWSGGSEEK